MEGEGWAKPVLPSRPCSCWLLRWLGSDVEPLLQPAPCEDGEAPILLPFQSANHIMVLKAFLNDYLVFNFKWVFCSNSWEFMEYL